jgi:hypothetical protein
VRGLSGCRRAAIGLFLLASLSAKADGRIFVVTPAGLEGEATTNETIKQECVEGARAVPPPEYGLQATPLLPLKQEVVAQTVRFLSARKADVEEIQNPAKVGVGRVLTLTIVAIEGGLGGVYSGRKGITVEAVLRQDGKEIGVREFTRRSTFGPVGGPDTCIVLNRIAAAIGRDVADWLVRTLAKRSRSDGAGTSSGTN